jgi:hypothetical protein
MPASVHRTVANAFKGAINSRPEQQIINHCSHVQLALTVGSEAHIDRAPLCKELIGIQSFAKTLKHNHATNKLNMEDLYPNMWLSLRILLTMPVSVDGG